MYICNRCGCSAMAEIGKKLTCLNCGNEQPKALSRKRESCAPNTVRHNAQTAKNVGASPGQAPKTTASSKAQPVQQKKAAPKWKKPLGLLVAVLIGFALLFNVILPAIFGVISEVTDIFGSGAEQVEGLSLPEEMTAFEEDLYADYEPDEYRYIEETPWYYINAEGTLLFDDYTYFDEGNRERDLYLPDLLLDFPVSRIGYDAFLFCEGIETVTIPDSVTVIETDAFYGCEDLREIWLPASITHIYYDAVYDCPDLEAIYYAGTAEQWDAIYIEEPNDQLWACVVFQDE